MSKHSSFFWPSYSDLMTSLFFVMLVLFVLTVSTLVRHVKATQEQLNKIREIEESVENLSQDYFVYNENYKKHILHLNLQFPRGISDIKQTYNSHLLPEIIQAGREIERIVNTFAHRDDIQVQYLVIIEGQASSVPFVPTDECRNNDVLSYQRALALRAYWLDNGIDLENNPNCELIVAGSGEGGFPREPDQRDHLNQRFMIHIIPKPGVIE